MDQSYWPPSKVDSFASSLSHFHSIRVIFMPYLIGKIAYVNGGPDFSHLSKLTVPTTSLLFCHALIGASSTFCLFCFFYIGN